MVGKAGYEPTILHFQLYCFTMKLIILLLFVEPKGIEPLSGECKSPILAILTKAPLFVNAKCSPPT